MIKKNVKGKIVTVIVTVVAGIIVVSGCGKKNVSEEISMVASVVASSEKTVAEKDVSSESDATSGDITGSEPSKESQEVSDVAGDEDILASNVVEHVNTSVSTDDFYSEPTEMPTEAPEPTETPTEAPTETPTEVPTEKPTASRTPYSYEDAIEIYLKGFNDQLANYGKPPVTVIDTQLSAMCQEWANWMAANTKLKHSNILSRPETWAIMERYERNLGVPTVGLEGVNENGYTYNQIYNMGYTQVHHTGAQNRDIYAIGVGYAQGYNDFGAGNWSYWCLDIVCSPDNDD